MKQETLWTKEFILANLILFSLNMGYFILYSTIGIYTRGLTNIELYVGLVTGIFTFASLCTRFFSGKLLDHAAPKQILLLGLILSLAASLGYLFADHMPLLIAMRILNGLGYGLSSAAAATIVSSMLPSSRLLEGLGYSQMAFTVCGALGPSIGLNLSHSDAQQFENVFLVTVFFAALSVLLTVCLRGKQQAVSAIKDQAALAEKTQQPRTISLATLIFLLLTFLLAFAQSTVVACLNLYALDRQLGNMSLFFIIFAVINFGVRLSMGKILQIVSERIILIGITALLVLVYLGIFAADSAVWIFLLAIPFGFSMGFYYPLMTTKVIRTVSPFRQGTSNTIYLAAEDIAFFLGAVFWSGISPWIGGYQNIYFFAALLACCMLLIVIFYPAILKKFHVQEDVW